LRASGWCATMWILRMHGSPRHSTTQTTLGRYRSVLSQDSSATNLAITATSSPALGRTPRNRRLPSSPHGCIAQSSRPATLCHSQQTKRGWRARSLELVVDRSPKNNQKALSLQSISQITQRRRKIFTVDLKIDPIANLLHDADFLNRFLVASIATQGVLHRLNVVILQTNNTVY